MLYHAAGGIKKTPHATALSDIETTYHVELVYGQRRFENKDHNINILTDVILVNVSNSNEDLTGQFKWELYEHFGIDSTRYESEWE